MRLCRVVVMGPSGVGKTHIGAALATELGLRFVDADDLHSAAAIEWMRAGNALSDDDRAPWLARVARALADAPPPGLVVACSALKRAYRDTLCAAAPDLFFVELDAPAEVIAARLEWRDGHFMPPTQLAHQLATLEHLEAEENGFRLDATWPDDELVAVASELVRAIDQ